ncbi:MAG: NAD(P)-binding domain-containing protein [Pseudomonadales bacterium]|nr:NAD(P)-binding domain-containing protein [Pseudomonadales bacterium]
MTRQQKIDVAVVGAGPSGLILSKLLAMTGASFRVFERNSDVGGIWDIDAPNSPMYESAHFISSRTLSGFPDFPMPDNYPDYPNHKQLLDYIRGFADAFNLRQHIQFNSDIIKAQQTEEGDWLLEFADGTTQQCGYLICANGVTWEPNLVTWPGEFNGEIRHSVTYRSANEFNGKRVLIVGAGNSGVDIACDASFAADQAYLSVRRGYHFMPKHIMGKPSDVFAKEGPQLPFKIQQTVFGWMLKAINGNMTRYGLPEPDHKVFETHPILNTQILHYLGHGDCIAKPDIDHLDGNDVVFIDGSREQIDLIITATGYQHSIPFLDDNTIDFKNGRPNLYLNLFSRKHTNLAVLGFIEFASAAYENFTRMAELIVADATTNKNAKLASLKKSHHPDLKGGKHYLKTKRNANYVNVDTYLKTLDQVKKDIGLKQTL